MVRELNFKYYYLWTGVYYGFSIADRLTPTVAGVAWYSQPDNSTIAAFSEFDDAERYMGKIVGVQFLIRHFLRHAFSRWNFCRRAMQRTGGKYLRGDHSFKLVKKMVVDGERPFVAVFCVMNEYSEIVGYWFVRTKSQNELRNALKAIERRYRQFGYRRIELWFTDDVDAEFGTLTSIFPSLKTEWKPRSVGVVSAFRCRFSGCVDLPPVLVHDSATHYHFKGNIVVASSPAEVAAGITGIRQAATNGEKIGMDAEVCSNVMSSS